MAARHIYRSLLLSVTLPFFAPLVSNAQEVDVSVAVGPQVDPDSFRPVLSPYGEWVEAPGYGMVWRPSVAVVGPEFTPYATNGHWVYTDAGWTWVSNYDWGWAPFHYGNWVYADDYWAWVPGRVWAPAWVEWRYGGGYVGWAPMGYRGYHPRFAYVEVNHFTSVNIHENVIVGSRAETIAVRTEPMRSAQVVNGHPVAPISAGPRPSEIAQATGHPVTPVGVHTIAAATPPASAKGVHYEGGASPQHAVVTQKLPPEAARSFAPTHQPSATSTKPAPRSVAAVAPAPHAAVTLPARSEPAHSTARPPEPSPAPRSEERMAHPETPVAPQTPRSAEVREPTAQAKPHASPKPSAKPMAKPAQHEGEGGKH